jgi:hypothetical protein
MSCSLEEFAKAIEDGDSRRLPLCTLLTATGPRLLTFSCVSMRALRTRTREAGRLATPLALVAALMCWRRCSLTSRILPLSM